MLHENRDYKDINSIIIGLTISLIEIPEVNIPINSLSLFNFTKASTRPKTVIKGKIIYIRLGIIMKDRNKTSEKLTLKVVTNVKILVNCINQAIVVNIKKISVQDLNI